MGGVLRFGRRAVRGDRALVMAIVNRTPDSFYDRGAAFAEPAAMAAVDTAVAEGADILDIGGVRAGAANGWVDTATELRRVVPFIAAVRERYPDIVISVDTWRAEVAAQACREGADLINDSWAGYDLRLGEVAAEYGTGFVCSHSGGLPPRTDPHRVHYDDVVRAVIDDVVAAARRLVELGVPAEGILIDPTHDFGKNTWHGLELLRRAGELVATGWPVLMALSNKDFIGETLGTGVDDRVDGTLAATAVAALAGARVFRAHQVQRTRRVLEMVASITGSRPPSRALRALA
jgi:dihydropteroate synthase